MILLTKSRLESQAAFFMGAKLRKGSIMVEIERKIIARALAPLKKVEEVPKLVKPIPQYVEWVLLLTGLSVATVTFLYIWLSVL